MSDLGQKLIASVRAHAAAKPDYVYEIDGSGGSCVYVHNGCASCLIGQALWDVGVIDATLEGTPDNHLPFFSIVDTLQLDIDTNEMKWLRNVQHYQDAKYRWGHAVYLADEETPL